MQTVREYAFTRPLTLVVVGAGMTTGRRVAQRLWDDGHPIRVGSRFSEPRFDWRSRATWKPVLENAHAVFLGCCSDVPGADRALRAFMDLAVDAGVRRVVLLSRPDEAGARRCEQVIRDSGAEWTIVRSSRCLPDLDAAEAAVAALTEPEPACRIHESSGGNPHRERPADGHRQRRRLSLNHAC